MKIKRVLIVFVLAVALLGCGKREPRHIVIMPDVSGSIERESLEQAFKAIDELASHLQRGDRLTIIPILGDAEAEASGRILRFEIPANRQAYDTDLRDLRSKLNVSLKGMQASAVAHPGTKTDILGSIGLAEQEFDIGPSRSKEILIILSDFIQENYKFNFRTDTRLLNQTALKLILSDATKPPSGSLKAIHVYCGFLRSKEYLTLAPARKAAIMEFWLKYFERSGATPSFAFDGTGLIHDFIAGR